MFLLYKLEETAVQGNANGEAGWQDNLRGLRLGGGQQDQAQQPLPDAQNDEAHGSDNSDVMEEYDGEEQSDLEWYSFVFCIVLLLVVAWMTLLIFKSTLIVTPVSLGRAIFNSTLIVTPISLGRAIFNLIPMLPITHGIECNDICDPCFNRAAVRAFGDCTHANAS